MAFLVAAAVYHGLTSEICLVPLPNIPWAGQIMDISLSNAGSVVQSILLSLTVSMAVPLPVSMPMRGLYLPVKELESVSRRSVNAHRIVFGRTTSEKPRLPLAAHHILYVVESWQNSCLFNHIVRHKLSDELSTSTCLKRRRLRMTKELQIYIYFVIILVPLL